MGVSSGVRPGKISWDSVGSDLLRKVKSCSVCSSVSGQWNFTSNEIKTFSYTSVCFLSKVLSLEMMVSMVLKKKKWDGASVGLDNVIYTACSINVLTIRDFASPLIFLVVLGHCGECWKPGFYVYRCILNIRMVLCINLWLG